MTAAEAMPVPEESKKQPLAVRVGAELVGSFFICFAIYTICTLDAIVSNLNMAFIALMTGAAYAVMTLVRQDFRWTIQSRRFHCRDADWQNARA